jgi:hypothetical protein
MNKNIKLLMEKLLENFSTQEIEVIRDYWLLDHKANQLNTPAGDLYKKLKRTKIDPTDEAAQRLRNILKRSK